MAVLMNRREYCRYRGCDPSSLRYAIERGWVHPAPDGRIDVEQADAAGHWKGGTGRWRMMVGRALARGDLDEACRLLADEPTALSEADIDQLMKALE